MEFLISTNPGEAIRPLAKVVSGGELSRIMLAIKTILADRDETETLIFDEIDTGISGRTAQKVSEKNGTRSGSAIRSSASPICRRSRRWQILILKSKNVEENRDRHIDPSIIRGRFCQRTGKNAWRRENYGFCSGKCQRG